MDVRRLRSVRPRRAAHRGITLIEVLVVIGVLALLAAILIPAVQQSRNASRRAQCRQRLKQIGLALANFEGAHREYPDSYKWRIQLMPFLDEKPLFEQFGLLLQSSAGETEGLPENWSLERTVPAFVCPSDPVASEAVCVNYYANMGSGLQAYGFNGFISPKVGRPYYYGAYNVRHLHGVTRPADFKDGLSNTAAVSEAIVSPLGVSVDARAGNASRPQLLGWFWKTNGILIEADDLPELAEQCRTARERNALKTGNLRGRDAWPYREGGDVTVGPLIYGWGYDHVLPPNSPSCGGSYYGVYSATSYHPGGVNAVFGDGSVRFMSESIDSRVWTALGTRSGDEQIEGGY